MQRLTQVLQRIDQVNSEDPNLNANGTPKELTYSLQMTEMQESFAPDASELLRIATRAQHIKRWSIPRESFSMDRIGYLSWRTKLKKFHGTLTGELMKECGYSQEEIQRVDDLINKRALKTDPEAQCLEDITCLVFLSHYFDDFIAKHASETDKLMEIIQKTWKKMSSKGHAAALNLSLSPRASELIAKALSK
ncbi:hypothetical protein ADIS_3726 [Lunatimonas lonarensis]|uniref:DUF4202 domain-containing protein n=1 Tax=Lunatimonas lonarensis TaxID=1232681 RepID=R7ZNZ9_9BACT|nr:DUF4202 domain-containing protein [Lunatimonas lonarensis]EON75835.1 hypothetical protein ADIS_3726 [Lunatimonas lonarensis]